MKAGSRFPCLTAASISSDALKRPLFQIARADSINASVAPMPASGP